MATDPFTETLVLEGGAEVGVVVSWGPMANGDIGAPYAKRTWSDRAVQVEGTFGLGGTLRLFGSNDGVNFRQLNDPQGNAILITTAKIVQVTEATMQVQPQVTSGDVTTSLTVTMIALRKYR